MSLADVAVPVGQGWGVLAMNDSSSALSQPTLASRFQTFATSQFASDRRTNEILHTDVVLAGPNPKRNEAAATFGFSTRSRQPPCSVDGDGPAGRNA